MGSITDGLGIRSTTSTQCENNTTILNYQVRTIFPTFNFNFDHNSSTLYVSYINRSSNDHRRQAKTLVILTWVKGSIHNKERITYPEIFS
jgi:hypothetical protein